MVGDLHDGRCGVAMANDLGFTLGLDVAEEQRAMAAIFDRDHQRVIIHRTYGVRGRDGTLEGRLLDANGRVAALAGDAQRWREHARTLLGELSGDALKTRPRRCFAVRFRVAYRRGFDLLGSPQLVDLHRPRDRKQAEIMIGMRMGNDRDVDVLDAACAQKAHHCFARCDGRLQAAGIRRSTSVDEPDFSAGNFDDGGITLTDVEIGNHQYPVIAALQRRAQA